MNNQNSKIAKKNCGMQVVINGTPYVVGLFGFISPLNIKRKYKNKWLLYPICGLIGLGVGFILRYYFPVYHLLITNIVLINSTIYTLCKCWL